MAKAGMTPEIFRFPAHRGVNAIATAWMIIKEPFLDGAGIHLAVLTQMNRRLSSAIRLSGGIEAVHIRLVFLGADKAVQDWSEHKQKERARQHDQGKHHRLPDLCRPYG